MDLLPVTDGDILHCVHIKDFDRVTKFVTKQRIKTKNSFVRVVLSVLVVKMCWENIKKFVWALMVHNQ